MDKKNNGRTPTPLPKERLTISKHFNAIVNSYVKDESQRSTVMQAWMAKKPKSYAQINFPLYRFNTIALTVLHLLSFLGAISIVGYLQTLGIGNSFYVFALIAVLFLAIAEFGQHAVLNTAFDIKHATNTIPQLLIALVCFFSILSIVTSTIGAKHFALTYGKAGHFLAIAALFVSIAVEILIWSATWQIHQYQKTVYNESVLINDLYQDNRQNPFFNALPNVKRLKTIIAEEENQSYVLPPVSKQILPIRSPSISVVPTPANKPYARNFGAPIADKQTPIVTKTKQKKQIKTPPLSGQKPVKTYLPLKKREKEEATVWSNAEIKNQLNIYTKRGNKQKKEKGEMTKANRAGVWFFTSILDKKKSKKIDGKMRIKLYEEHLNKSIKNPLKSTK